MSSEPETEWMNISFDFKFSRTTVDFQNVDRLSLLAGMAKAVAYMLLPEEEYESARILVKNLSLEETEFLTDSMINKALDLFENEGEEP